MSGKAREGRLGNLTKKHKHHDAVREHLSNIHHAPFRGMKELLVKITGDVWDKWIRAGEDLHNALTGIWNEYLLPGGRFSCFSLSDTAGVPNATPANQAQEIWHSCTVKTVLKGKLRQSTATLVQHWLPKILYVDGLNMPDELPLEV